ncbi:hypothetical protein MOF39_11750 [Bacillus inaquosorum]|uniref:hypothetical protein n=1 Tax=Bacillus inaquosorum TaxID=483913 RepID=UPI0022829338|nr:hypothetical protein [Bacillus inaquosorum]MCY9383753.1 hypothetical protein [Bacillus inaquosorum]MEC0536118.1 hypothetical protein [Bacillus inaquosorum]
MNEYEELYNIKKNLELNINKSKVFDLSIREAVIVIFEKLGVFYTLLNTAEYEKVQEVIKKLVKTNASEINEISFIQESLKWIIRWCSSNCRSESKINKEDILADDIYNLMGKAYSYDRFVNMWEMHSQKKVKYNKRGNKITFDYHQEETYITHLLYESYFKEIEQAKNLEKLDVFGKISNENLIQVMNFAHQIDFNCSFNIEFDQFNLEDYKMFSTALTEILTKKRLENSIEGNYIIDPRNEGILIYKKEKWVYEISTQTNLSNKKIGRIIDFFTYDFSNPKSDISLSYFVSLSNEYLLVSEAVHNLSRPGVNAMRLLAKKRSSNYDSAQNNFEMEERVSIIESIGNKYLTSYGIDKSQKNIPGIDLVVYDPEEKHLHIIELKYKIPVESTLDINNLDKMLNKAYKQVEIAKGLTKDRIGTLLEEYFGEPYIGTEPKKVDYFVLTNYSIGTGINNITPSPILLIDHYIELMKQRNGMELVRTVLNSSDKKLPLEKSKRYSRFSLSGYKILIPEYSFMLKQDHNIELLEN